jgi:hypothetical protein
MLLPCLAAEPALVGSAFAHMVQAKKDSYYRLLNNERRPWRSLQMGAAKILKARAPNPHGERPRSFLTTRSLNTAARRLNEFPKLAAAACKKP